MSPPPKEEADDYLNHGRRSHGSKHVGKQARRHNNTREEAGLVSSGLRTPASGTRSIGGRESWDASTNASDGDNIADATFFMNTNQLKLNTQTQDHQTIAGYEPVRVPTWSMFRSSVDEVKDVDSPAMKALRSLNQPPSHDVQNSTLRRVSNAFVATFGLLPNNSPTSDSPDKADRRSEASQERSARHNNFPKPTRGPSRRTTFKGSKEVSGMLGTPATITLRKASNVYAPSPVLSSMNASLLNECIHKSDPSAPASELLAFYSTPGALSASPTTPHTDLPEESGSPSSLNTEASLYPNLSPRSARKKSLSMALFKNDRRCSYPAEATLTFADVHVATGSFATESRFGNESLMPAECLRRISVVHFRSRNSVHEVIWREDETTSGSSLASNSTSPPRQACFSRSDTVGPEGENSLIGHPGTIVKSQDNHLPVAPVSTPNVDRPQEALAQWSWGESTSSVGLIGQPIAPTSANLGFDIPTSDYDSNLFAQPKSSVRRKPSSSEPHSVDSFTPFLNRSSTFEWRREPSIDLDDPLTGRSQYSRELENTYFAEAGVGVLRLPDFSSVG
ncbi:hypothetical protein N7G274_000745 [Stereocaulon virgatum]|uniref:Uncharacterized protein n=1 Tax=Stereocaulon virgatum TaxID=373712 RepID=A0ABR4ARC7_9LECA